MLGRKQVIGDKLIYPTYLLRAARCRIHLQVFITSKEYINCVVCAFVRLSVQISILGLRTSTGGPNFGFQDLDMRSQF